RGGRSERLHADDATGITNVPFPTKCRSLLDRDARFHFGWQHAIPVFPRLVLKDIPGRYRDHARSDAFRNQLLVRFDGKTDFAAGSDEDQFWIFAWSIGKDVGSFGDTARRRVFVAVQPRQRLPRQSEYRRFVTQLHDVPVRFDHLVSVAGPQRDEPWNGAQGSELLHWLVRRAVFTVTHRIVR